MSGDLANLVLGVDSTQVEAGIKSLDRLAEAGARAEKATANRAKTSATATDTLRKEQEALGAQIVSINRNTAAYERLNPVSAVYDRQGRAITATSIRMAEAHALNAREVEAHRDRVINLSMALRILAAGFIAVQAVSYITGGLDDWTKVNAQLKNATTSQSEYKTALANTISISNQSQSSLGATATVYARLNNAMRDAGNTQDQVKSVVQTLTLALKVNGATTEETTSSLLQMSQAFGKGKLDGDEFRTSMEAAPNVMRILAKSMRVPFGALKDLAKQGELTNDVLIKAFTDQSVIDGLAKQAEAMHTAAGGWQVLKNNVEAAAGKLNEAVGFTTALSKSMEFLGNNLYILAGLAVGLGVALAGMFSSQLIAGMAAFTVFITGPVGLIAMLVGATVGVIGYRQSLEDLSKDNSAFTFFEKLTLKVATVSDVMGNLRDELMAIAGSFRVVFSEINVGLTAINPVTYTSKDRIKGLARDIIERDRILAEANADWDALVQKDRDSNYNAALAKIDMNYMSEAYGSGRGHSQAGGIGFSQGDSKTAAQIAKERREAEAYVKALSALQEEAFTEELQRNFKLQEDNDKKVKKAIDDSDKIIEQYSKANESGNQSLRNLIEAQLKHNRELGLTKEQVDKLNEVRYVEIAAQYESAAASADAGAAMAGEDEQRRKMFVTLAAEHRLRAQLATDMAAAKEQGAIAEAAEVARKQWEDATKKVEGYFHSSFLNIGKKGTSIWKSMVSTFKETFRTGVLEYIYQQLAKPFVINIIASLAGVLGSSGLANAASNMLGSSSGSSTLGILSTGKSIFDGLSGIQGSITGGIEKLGVMLSTGNGGLLDSLGGFLGANAGAIGDAIPFAGAALQALTGNLKGAAFTAVGAALGSVIPGLGTALGGMIGGLVGSLFGGAKRYTSSTTGSYSGGVFTSAVGQHKRTLGAESSLAGLSEAFSGSLGSLLSAFGLDDTINTSASLTRKKKSNADFSASFDGGSAIFHQGIGKKGDVTQLLKDMVESVMSTTLISAIQSSKLGIGIKSLFDSMVGSTQVASMLTATINLNKSQAELASSFGLTVEQAAQAAKATGLIGDALIEFVNQLPSAAGSNSASKLLMTARANLIDIMGGALPETLSGYDAVIKSIDKSNATGITKVAQLLTTRAGFEQYMTAIGNLKSGVSGSVLSLRTPQAQASIMQAELTKMFGALGLSVPKSKAQLVAMGDSIDYTTEAGLNLAQAFPDLVKAFMTTQEQVDSLTASLNIGADSFATLVDYNRFKGVSANYGTQLANDYTYNLGSGRIAQNQNGSTTINDGEGNQDIVVELQSLRDDLASPLNSMATSSAQTAKMLRLWNGDGMPPTSTRDV